MDTKIVRIVEKEVPDFSVGGNSGVGMDSSFRQVENGEFENKGTCEPPPLPVKSFMEGLDQMLDSKLVAECLKYRSLYDVLEVDAKIEDIQEVQGKAAKSQVAEFPEQHETDQELIPEIMAAKAASIAEIEVLDVSSGSTSEAHLNSCPRQIEDREFGDHVSNEQLSLSAKSSVHGGEHEPSSSIVDHFEKRTVDLHVADTEMEDVKEVLEQAVDSEAFKLPTERVINQELVSEKIDAKVISNVEKESPYISAGGSPNSDSCSRQVGVREHGHHAVYEKPSLPVKSLVKVVDCGLEYDSGLAENLERRTGDFYEVDSEMVDVREMEEQAADTELPKVKEVSQELVAKKSVAKVVPIIEKEIPDVSVRGSLDLDSGPWQAGERNNGDNSAYEQPASPINSIDRGLVHEREYEPGSSFACDFLEHGATGGISEADTFKDVKKLQEQASIMEVVESPKELVDQEMVHQEVDAKVLITETEIPDVSDGGSSVADLYSGLRQDGDRKYEDNIAQHQPSLQVKSFVKGVHHVLGYESSDYLEFRATGENHEFDRDVENVNERVEQAASMAGHELPEKQEVDQELVYIKMDADIASIRETQLPNDSVGGSSAAALDSGPGQVQDREYGDHTAYERPSLPANSLSEGIDNRLEHVAGSIVDEDVEHGVMGEVHKVDRNMDDVQEVQEQAANRSNTEAIELPEEQEIDLELVSVNTNVKVLVEKTEVSDALTRGSPGVYIDSSPSQIGDGEYGDQAACDEPTFPVQWFADIVDQGPEYKPGSTVVEHLEHSASDDVHEVDTIMSASNEGVSPEEQGDLELVPYSAKPWSKEENNAKHASLKRSLMKDHRVSYQPPAKNEGEFAVFDLVWGKVKSHPWWPGQIFHPSDSSEKAMKYYRKDCYLVAYFGDRTFAWNEASVLKPFRNHFPLAERQSNSEAFQNAVSCALEEVTRRVELGLSCSCLSEEAYDKIKYQVVENTGIREESSKREGVDRSTGVDCFQIDKFIEYIRTLALFPTSDADRLEFSVAKAQLLAFNRLKGCDVLPEFQYYEGLVEYDADTPIGDRRMLVVNEHNDSLAGVDAKKSLKQKHYLKDIVYQRRKEKNMTELMSEYYLDGEFDSHEEDNINLTSHSIGTKRKFSGFLPDDSPAQKSIKSISSAKVSCTAYPNPQQSFKVGECISRVASQLTGSSVIIKGCSEGSINMHSGDDADKVSDPSDDALVEDAPTPSKEFSLDEMLSLLHLSARDPLKGYSFFGDVINFFTEFRNLAVTTQRQIMCKGSSRRRKSSVPVVGSPETFEFDDKKDSYGTNMVVQNSAEAKPARRGRKRKDEQVVSGDPEKPLRPNCRKYSRKQYHFDNHDLAPAMPIKDKKQLDLPTELMLNFDERISVLSEVNLNKMFRCFGPLKESETEIDMQSSRARVVFKKRSDAEVAYSSAAMFNIFGSAIVNYQLNYTPASLRNPLLSLSDAKMMQLDVL